jgi:ABC-type transporter Mla subunit MlaD
MRVGLSRASWTGLLAVAALAAVLVIGFVRPRLFDNGQVVQVAFRDVAAIARFDRTVRVAGADVGTIGDVRREGSVAVVELRFPNGAIGPVHTDATAALRPHLVFDGTAYVDFSPGSPGAPLLGGRTLGLDHTSDYVSLDLALRVANSDTRSALRGVLHDLAQSLGAREVGSLRQTFSGQPRLFASLAPAMRALQGSGRRELTGAIRGFARTLDGLSRERDSLNPLLRGSAQTIEAMRTQADQPLDQTLVTLPPALVSAAAGGAALRSVLDELQPLAAELTPGMTELAPTLLAMRPVLEDARPLLDPTTRFVAELRAALSAGGGASAPASGVLHALDPTLEILRRGLLPFLHSKPRAGIPVYRRLAAVGASAGASMSGVRSPEVAKQLNTGPGHGWHFYTASLTGSSGSPSCATVPAAIRATISQLGLCIG